MNGSTIGYCRIVESSICINKRSTHLFPMEKTCSIPDKVVYPPRNYHIPPGEVRKIIDSNMPNIRGICEFPGVGIGASKSKERLHHEVFLLLQEYQP